MLKEEAAAAAAVHGGVRSGWPCASVLVFKCKNCAFFSNLFTPTERPFLPPPPHTMTHSTGVAHRRVARTTRASTVVAPGKTNNYGVYCCVSGTTK